MPAPTAALGTQRQDLASSFEAFDVEASRAGFIAQRVAPILEVASQAGTFGKIPVEQLLQNRDTLRAPGAGYSRSQFKFTPASYATEEHGAEEPADERESRMYADFFDLELVAARRAADVVLRNAEVRMASLIINTTTWTGASLTTAVGTAWTTIALAAPITDVEGAVQKVRDNSGLIPNAIVLGWKAFRNARRCAQVLDNIKYSGLVDPRPGKITEEALAQVFGLKYCIVGDPVKNTANEAQAFSGASIWDDTKAMVCRVAETNDPREPCIARTFHWAEDGSEPLGRVESYDEPQTRARIIRVRHDVDELVMYTQAGHLLTGL